MDHERNVGLSAERFCLEEERVRKSPVLREKVARRELSHILVGKFRDGMPTRERLQRAMGVLEHCNRRRDRLALARARRLLLEGAGVVSHSTLWMNGYEPVPRIQHLLVDFRDATVRFEDYSG